jgi:phosphoribosylamine--glycine ligase
VIRASVVDRVLIVGSGAREHAFAAAFAREGAAVVTAPGNAGTSSLGPRVKVASGDIPGLVEVAKREQVSLVFVGPEAPLALGLVDALDAAGIRAFGPTASAARLESSKVFMKRFLKRHGIPTADFQVFDRAAAAHEYVRRAQRPLVVKADGLAAGKGVVVAGTPEEATDAVERMMVGRAFGSAGDAVVVEEVLPGEEASFHVVTDGERFVSLAPAQDHKRLKDGDFGPNTGGMGAYAPAPVVGPAQEAAILSRIIEPTLAGLRKEGIPFRGVLFAGIMMVAGEPLLLEFNVRFGDPEATVLVPANDGSWLDLVRTVSAGSLDPSLYRPSGCAALSVVLAAQGYPGAPVMGDVIGGLDAVMPPGTHVFHAGTEDRADRADRDPREVVTAGGRVLTICGTGETLEIAAARAYDATSRISFRGSQHRTDIGARALRRSV